MLEAAAKKVAAFSLYASCANPLLALITIGATSQVYSLVDDSKIDYTSGRTFI